VGDSLTGIGSGSSTVLALGYNSSPSVAGNNGYGIINPTAGTATRPVFTGTPPNAGDHRLGITFTDASHIWGTAGTTLRYSSFSGASASLLNSFTPTSNAERLMAYTTLGGVPLLAVQSTGDSHVSIYDVSTPATPVLLATGNNTTLPAANANGTGQIAWGNVIDPGNGQIQQTLYAMSSNQGIQAFIVTVPEPGTFALGALGLGVLVLARRFRK
jgi:hypothetical protein